MTNSINLGLIQVKLSGNMVEKATQQYNIIIDNFPVTNPPKVSFNSGGLTKQSQGTIRSQSYKIPQSSRIINLSVLCGSQEEYLLDKLANHIADTQNGHTFDLEFIDANPSGINYSCKNATIKSISEKTISTEHRDIVFICESTTIRYNK